MDNLADYDGSPQERPALVTILSLLFVIGFSLFIAAILVPGYLRARKQGQLTQCKSNLRTIGAALSAYAEDHEKHYPAGFDDLIPNYLKSLPLCPKHSVNSYRLQVGPQAPGNGELLEDYYIVWCEGNKHNDLLVPQDYPKWNSSQGPMERPQ